MDRTKRAAVITATALGVAAGSYGIASAASGSGSNSNGSSSAGSRAFVASAPTARQPWGHQRSDETLLTGDTAAKVRQLALTKVPGGTIVRVETDADGNAAYEPTW